MCKLSLRSSLLAAALISGGSLAVGQSPRILWQQPGDSGTFQSIDFSPSGETIVHGSYRTFRTFQVKDGASVMRFGSPTTYGLSGLAFSPDGSKIYSASFDLTLQTWEAATGQLLLTTWQNPWSNVAVTPDGSFLAVGLVGSGTMRILNEPDHSQVMALSGHSGAVAWIAFSNDGKLMATAGWDGKAIVRHTGALPIIWTFQAHAGVARSVAFSPDGSRLVTGGNDGFARVWDLETSQMVAELHHGGMVTSVAWSSDGRAIATASLEPAVRIFGADTFVQVVAYTQQMGDGPMTVQFSPDSRLFAYARRDGMLVMAQNPLGRR